jgi:15-cis-phytoene synthase
VPETVLNDSGAGWLTRQVGRPVGGALPAAAGPALATPVRRLLALAEVYYRSGDAGLAALRWRCALAIRVARTLYAAIGGRIAARGHDVLAGRVYVSAVARSVASAVGRAIAPTARAAHPRRRR